MFRIKNGLFVMLRDNLARSIGQLSELSDTSQFG